ncbi:MAG: hypothetical protein J6J60_04650 [Clostridia bacterium]|nr:hypothetical protein [Clostridia bacterium]
MTIESTQKGEILEKLKYLNFDIDNVPEEILQYEPLNFTTSRLNNDKNHRIFKFIPIDKIEILLTPCLRGDSVKDKYSKALPLNKYLIPNDSEESLERYTTFLKMLKTFSIPEVESINITQNEMARLSEPFRVKYNKDHLWQIYYSENTDKYFMLVCTKEETYSEFFYLLKRKIEYIDLKQKEVPKIYVPINYINYSENFLTINEIADLENYLWLFTKNWASVYEVYDKDNKMSIQIIGETFVYDQVKSTYKIKLINSDEAIKFYKLLKALFILQTEIKDQFEFKTKIDSKNGLELYYGMVRITYDSLTDFIKNQYEIAEEEIRVQNENRDDLEKKLNSLKIKSIEKENEYIEAQREISTYLEYKKTFFGKVKYFFKGSGKVVKKKNKSIEDTIKADVALCKKEKTDLSAQNVYISENGLKTIEDLVTIYNLYEKGEKYFKDLEQDIKAMKNKVENLEKKVENAKLYIEEIDKHKKSIFGFWKFANKDENLALEMGNIEVKSQEIKNIQKTFDYESDFELLGKKMDKIQRKKLSRDEIESVFVADSRILPALNMLRIGEMDKNVINYSLEKLREEFNKTRLYIDEDTFDIFGNIDDASRKIKYIGSKSHRENERNKYKILNVNKKIDIFDYTEKLQSILNYIDGATPKIKSEYDMSLYKLVTISEQIKEHELEIYNINIEKELENYEDRGEGALNLIKLNFKENMPLIYYTNILYYDNVNQTLPEGMDISTKVLVDNNKFEFSLVSKNKFRTNNYFRESNNLIFPKSKDIFVYEYNVELKSK